MNPSECVSSLLRNFINFSGRASREEFWWGTLLVVITSVILALITAALAFTGQWWLVNLFLLMLAVPLLPYLAVTVRRLHDTGRSARWLLIYTLVVAGWVVWFFLALAWFVVTGDSAPSGEPVSESSRDSASRIIWGFISLCSASFAGWVILLALCAFPGTAGPNRYGPHPLSSSGIATGSGGTGNLYENPPPSAGFSGVEPGSAPPSSASLTLEGQRRYCTQCGTQLRADARFCTYCGTSI